MGRHCDSWEGAEVEGGGNGGGWSKDVRLDFLKVSEVGLVVRSWIRTWITISPSIADCVGTVKGHEEYSLYFCFMGTIWLMFNYCFLNVLFIRST